MREISKLEITAGSPYFIFTNDQENFFIAYYLEDNGTKLVGKKGPSIVLGRDILEVPTRGITLCLDSENIDDVTSSSP